MRGGKQPLQTVRDGMHLQHCRLARAGVAAQDERIAGVTHAGQRVCQRPAIAEAQIQSLASERMHHMRRVAHQRYARRDQGLGAQAAQRESRARPCRSQRRKSKNKCSSNNANSERKYWT